MSYKPVCIPIQYQPVYDVASLVPLTAPATPPGAAYTLPLTHPAAIQRVTSQVTAIPHRNYTWLWWVVGGIVIFLVIAFIWDQWYRGISIRNTGNPTPNPQPSDTRTRTTSVNSAMAIPDNRNNIQKPNTSNIIKTKIMQPIPIITVRELQPATDYSTKPKEGEDNVFILPSKTQNVNAASSNRYLTPAQKMEAIRAQAKIQRAQTIMNYNSYVPNHPNFIVSDLKDTNSRKPSHIIPRYWSNSC